MTNRALLCLTLSAFTLLPPVMAHAQSAALAPAPQDGIAPHRAVYAIKTIARSSGSQVLNVMGEMTYDLKSGCEAWQTTHNFDLHYEYADSTPLQITSDFTTYEPYSGKSLDYNTRRKRDAALFEEIRGHAALNDGDNATGTARFNMPPDLHFDLPAGTLFPVAHAAALRDHLNGPAKFFNATVFDGNNKDGPVEINAFIGDAVPASDIPQAATIDAPLLTSPARRLRMAFFPLEQNETTPDYEMTAIFHENGIISDMIVDYRDFSIHQSLTSLSSNPREECAQSP